VLVRVSCDQQRVESVEDFIAEMTGKAREAEVSDDMLVYALMRGMCPELRAYVMGQVSQLYCGC